MNIDIAVWGPNPVVSHFLKVLMESGWEAHASPDDPSKAYAFTVPASEAWEGGVIDDTPDSSFTVISNDRVIDVERVDGANITFDTDESRRDRRITNRTISLNKLIELEAPSVIVEHEKRMLQEDMLLDSEVNGRSRTVADRFATLMKDTQEDRPEYLPRSGDELAYIISVTANDDPCPFYATAIIDAYYDAGLRFRFLCWNVLDQPRSDDAEGKLTVKIDWYYLFFSAPTEEAKGKQPASRHCVGFINGPEWWLNRHS